MCGDDVHGAVYFLTDSDEKAGAVEDALRGICILAPLVPEWRVPDVLRPVQKLLGRAKVSRDGTTVILGWPQRLR